MFRPFKLTSLIERWLDSRAHCYVHIHTFHDYDTIFVRGHDNVCVYSNKFVEVQPSYMIDINDPDFFGKLSRRLGLSSELEGELSG